MPKPCNQVSIAEVLNLRIVLIQDNHLVQKMQTLRECFTFPENLSLVVEYAYEYEDRHLKASTLEKLVQEILKIIYGAREDDGLYKQIFAKNIDDEKLKFNDAIHTALDFPSPSQSASPLGSPTYDPPIFFWGTSENNTHQQPHTPEPSQALP